MTGHGARDTTSNRTRGRERVCRHLNISDTLNRRWPGLLHSWLFLSVWQNTWLQQPKEEENKLCGWQFQSVQPTATCPEHHHGWSFSSRVSPSHSGQEREEWMGKGQDRKYARTYLRDLVPPARSQLPLKFPELPKIAPLTGDPAFRIWVSWKNISSPSQCLYLL